MERNAHYAMVGLISIFLTIGAAVFIVWLAGDQFQQRYDVYDVAFHGPVHGLSIGGGVYFNGIKVGEVTKLRLDAKDPKAVEARIRITSDSPVRTDSTASLEPQGVTGVNYIQISAGSINAPLLKKVTPFGEVGVIQSTQSTLESLLEGGGNVLTRAVEALDRFNRLLSEQNINEVSGTLADIHAISTKLRNQDQMLADLDASVKSINQTSDKIGALADESRALVNGDGKRTLVNLADAAAELKLAAADARIVVTKLQEPASDFATTSLPQINRTVTSLQTAAESLDRLVGELERNPSGVLTKAPARTVEVKP